MLEIEPSGLDGLNKRALSSKENIIELSVKNIFDAEVEFTNINIAQGEPEALEFKLKPPGKGNCGVGKKLGTAGVPICYLTISIESKEDKTKEYAVEIPVNISYKLHGKEFKSDAKIKGTIQWVAVDKAIEVIEKEKNDLGNDWEFKYSIKNNESLSAKFDKDFLYSDGKVVDIDMAKSTCKVAQNRDSFSLASGERVSGSLAQRGMTFWSNH
jgi:hypothetical protein